MSQQADVNISRRHNTFVVPSSGRTGNVNLGGGNQPGGAIIDDDSTAANRVWSAQKLNSLDEEDRIRDLNPSKRLDYLYDIEVVERSYPDSYVVTEPNLGTVFRDENFVGRNYDAPYSNTAQFLVHASAHKGKHESIGIAGGISELTSEAAESGEWTSAYDVIPMIMLDGINDAGVFCCAAEVPIDDKPLYSPQSGDELAGECVVRFVLDEAESAQDAVNKLVAKKIVFRDKAYHWMIADEHNTCVLEVTGNAAHVISTFPNQIPLMTNFWLAGFNGEAVTGFERGGIDPEETTLTAHAKGVERYSEVVYKFGSITSKDALKTVLSDIPATDMYDDSMASFWYSDYVGDHRDEGWSDITVYNSDEECISYIMSRIRLFRSRTRDGATMGTRYSVIYDISKRTMSVCTEQSGRWRDLALDISDLVINQAESGLPPVTEADNGKVLAVVNGGWDARDLYSETHNESGGYTAAIGT